MKKKLYVLCWGLNSDDEPFWMLHHRYYSSNRLALEAMSKLIKANIGVPSYEAIAEDLNLNQLIRIQEWDMDNMVF